MVYRRYRKRRRRFRTRSRRKRGKMNRRISRIAMNSVHKSIAGIRNYAREDRSQGTSTAQDTIVWKFVCSMGTNDGTMGAWDTILTDTAGQTGTAVAANLSDQHRRYKIINQRLKSHLRNVSNQPCFVTLYQIHAKQHVEVLVGGATTLTGFAMDALVKGWKQDLDTTADNYITYINGEAQCVTDSSILNISDSKLFSKYFKVAAKKRYKLHPGDDLYWNLKVPPFSWSPKFMNQKDLHGDDRQKIGVKGFSRMTLIRVEGCLGKANDNDTEYGLVPCDLAFECHVRARSYCINHFDDEIGLRVVTDDLTGQTLEGPTDFEVKDGDE